MGLVLSVFEFVFFFFKGRLLMFLAENKALWRLEIEEINKRGDDRYRKFLQEVR